MKSEHVKLLILLVVVAVLPVCSQAAGNQASARDERIEQAYTADFAELEHLAESYAQRFTVNERLLWLEFFKQRRSPYANQHSLYLPDVKLSTLKGSDRRLRGTMMSNYSLRNFARLLMSDRAYQLLNTVAESRYTSSMLRRKALALLAVMEQLHNRAEEIEAHRDSQLAKLESPGRVIVESPASAGVQIPAQQLGLVSAISYDCGNSLCMVEGVDEILTAGDVINTEQIQGVKVLSISQNTVEFQKAGRSWKQALGESPKALWTK